LKAVLGKEFCAILERHGWEPRRIEGSHHISCKSGRRETISVPVHGNRALKIGLQRHFMRVGGQEEGNLSRRGGKA
jgi:predicted RNA binding protein YcfA (HicA-like mRNA interferase family)